MPGKFLFRLLLLAYPRDFRRRYREELLAFYRADRQNPRHRGVSGLFRFWAATLTDLVRTALAERLASARAGRPGRVVGADVLRTPITRAPVRMETFISDLRQAFRALCHSPRFATLAALTLALGIGATAAMFSVVNGVLLRELPYEDADRVVMLSGGDTDGRFGVSENERLRYRERTDLFESVAAFRFDTGNLTARGDAERLIVAVVDVEIFSALGAAPSVGRAFRPDEGVAGQDLVAILSHDHWMSRSGSRTDIIGEVVTLDGTPRTIVGVMPPGFRLPGDFVGEPVQLYLPLSFSAAPDPQNVHYLQVAARLRTGVDLAHARARLAALSEQLKTDLPTLPPTFTVTAVPVREDVLGEIEPKLLLLLGAVGLVLLLACVNVANLFLARADARLPELSLRAALGASRLRLVASLLAESLVIAVAGGALGLLAAETAGRLLVRLDPPNLPRVDQIGVDARVLAFTAVLSCAAVLIFGLAPALKASRRDPRDVLVDVTRTATRDRRRVRQALVVVQLALAVTLATGAGLLWSSLARLQAVEPGFDSTNVVTLRINLPSNAYPDRQSAQTFYTELLREVRELPGVSLAGAVASLPLAGDAGDWGIRIEGREDERLPSGRRPWADRHVATDGFFETLGIPIVEGRSFTAADVADAPQVVIVNETAARHYWPDESAVGKRFKLSANIDTVYRTIVGVAQDVKHDGLGTETLPAMYLPHAQHPASQDFAIGSMSLVVRTAGDPLASVHAIRQRVRDLDTTVPVSSVLTMADVVARSVSTERLNLALFGFFGALGLLLVSVGVYAVTSYVMAQRTRELGIRIALGAAPATILRHVLAHGVGLTAAGVPLGVAGALALGRSMSGQLYGVTWHDPVILMVVPVTVTAVTLLASGLAARRATRVDPAEVLREER